MSSELYQKYNDHTLSTDEAAIASNEIADAIKELEAIQYRTGGDYILFKWGTLKSWDMKSPKGIKLSAQYQRLGSSISAMSQKDTDEQKQIICKMIDECNGTLQNDWDGNHYTKQQAKDYIMGYSS